MSALDRFEIRYLIVGGVAVSFHSVPRYTKDLDVLICIHPPEQERLFECLKEFGIPIHLVSAHDFLQPDFVFHFGIPPWRVDLLTSIPGVDFETAYEQRVEMPLGGYRATCLSKEWLVKAKLASGRPQDLADVTALTGPSDIAQG